MFTFYSLQGALSESSASQSILELDGGVKVLIDVGWDESFDPGKLKELEKAVPTLSLILLTHATVPHLAAFAHCCKHFPLFTRIPVYATTPVISLGRTLLQDLYASTPLAATTIPQSSLSEAVYSFSQTKSAAENFLLQPPTSEEIATYFSLVHPLKYSQPHQPLPSPFSPPLNGLTITTYNSGHSLGGTIWHIQHGLESIVYAVDWHQGRENVFAGAAWLGGAGAGGAEVIEQLRKPTALICSSKGSEKVAISGGRARRDEHLLELVKLCVARGGTALIPVDSSARVLELAYLLEHAWRIDTAKDDSVLKPARLFLAGRNVSSTMRYARSMLEWMDDNIVREFEAVADGRRANGAGDGSKKEAGPFDFRFLRLLERKAQIDKVLSLKTEEGDTIGKVILASDSSIEWGFSKEVLKGIIKDSRNLVILTDKPNLADPDRPSLGRTLWEWHKERKDGGSVDQTPSGDNVEQVYAGGRQIPIPELKRIPLSPTELSIYQQWLATQRQLHSTLQSGGATSLEASADVVDDASSESSSSSDESDAAQQGKALNVSATQASRKKVVLTDEDLGINILLKKKGFHDFDVRGKKGRERMFPLAVRRHRADEFGDLIRAEDFLRAEEREDADADSDANAEQNSGEQLGKKRKWDDLAAAPTSKDRNKKPGLVRGLSEDGGIGELGPTMQDGLDDVEDDTDEDDVLGPAKLDLSSTQTYVANLRIAHVDFSGLHDKRSLHMLIPLIAPRKLILVGGTESETQSLQSECRALLSSTLATAAVEVGEAAPRKGIEVFAPAPGVPVNASVDTNAWIVKLSDDLVRRLRWQTVRGLGIVTVTGQLLAAGPTATADQDQDPDAAHKRQRLTPAPSTNDDTVPVMSAKSELPILAPPTAAAATLSLRPAQAPLHVGDLRLADLRRQAQARGHVAEFRGEGTLVIDGTVAVRKTGTGRVEIESVSLPTDAGAGGRPGGAGMGAIGTFGVVREMVYKGLAIVAGG